MSALYRLAAVAALAVAAAPQAAAAGDISPWLPAPGSGNAELAYVRQEADAFWAGDAKMALPAQLSQDSVTLNVSYGVTERLAVDLQLGYAESHFVTVPGLAPEGGLDGFSDVVVGLRYKLLDDADGAPATVTLGVAGVIAGDYETGALPAIGDGASGVQVAVALGRQFGPVSLSGDIGRSFRGDGVPDEWFGSVQASYAVTSRISAFGAVGFVNSGGDLDIGGPGFTPDRFPEVEEDYGLWSVGAAFAVTERVSANLTYGHTFNGRNTSDHEVWRIGVGYAF